MKAVIDRAKSYYALLRASRRWSRPTAAALRRLLEPELAAGETLPDLELLQELFRRALERRWRRLVATDEACVAARGRHRALRRELEDATRALYRQLADLRTRLRGIFGADPSRWFLSLGGKTSRDPVVLLRQADRATPRLRQRALPPASFVPSAADRSRWSGAVAAAAEILRSVLGQATLAAQELEAGRVERRRALEGYDDLFVGIAGWLAATCRAAGRDDRAAELRPSRRRPGILLKSEGRRKPPAKPAGRAERRPSALATLRQAIRFRGGRLEAEPHDADPPRAVQAAR